MTISRRELLVRTIKTAKAAPFLIPASLTHVPIEEDEDLSPSQLNVRKEKADKDVSSIQLSKPITMPLLETNNPLFKKELEPRNTECPVYTYHEVPSPKEFASFVNNLLQQGLEPIKPSDLLKYFETGIKPWIKRPVIITFDDGYLSQLTHAVPVLLERNIPAAFAVMPYWKGDGDPKHVYMNDENIAFLAENGFELMSHTFNHPNLSALRRRNLGAWQAEIVESKTELRRITGQPVNFFVYPFGRVGYEVDEETIVLTKQYYQGAFSTMRGNMQQTKDFYVLKRFGRT